MTVIDTPSPDERYPETTQQAYLGRMHAPHPCPRCGDDLDRIRRRLVDRLSSVWRPVHRYQCRNPLCGWEGNLRTGEIPPQRRPESDGDRR